MKIKAILIITAVLLFCSCGIKPPQPTGQQPTAQVTQDPNLKDGGTLNICALRPDTFNPLFTGFAENREAFSLVFDPLITLGANFKPVPALAESWSISDKGKKLSLKLREGVKWHNGSEFTADDVVYTLNELQKGQKVSIYKNRLKNVQAVKKTGIYSLDISLNTPQAGFINLLDFPIIKRGTQADGNGIASGDMVGTGKYKMTAYTQLKSITLSANTSWWGAEKPHIPTVSVAIVPDYDSVLYSYNSRVIDVAAANNSEMSKYSLREGTEYATIPTNDYYFISLNMASLLFSDLEVRKALSTAIDQEKLVKNVLMGFAVPAVRPINPGAWFSSAQKSKKGVQETRQQLEISGWQVSMVSGVYEKKVDKRTIRLAFDLLVNEENALKCAIADYVSSELASCGIKANVKRVKFEEFQRLVSTGIFDAFVGSTRLPNDYDLSALLSTNGTLNYGHFTNQDLDNAIQAVNSAETPDEYAAALGQLQIVFNDQQPHIPLVFECRRLVYDGVRLAGDIKSGVSGQYEFENKWFIKK